MPIPAEDFKILAPAKVNLIFEILGKRPDGYHEIRSLMQPISLFDILWIKSGSKKLEVLCPGYPDLENEDNLICRAVRLLEKEVDQSFPMTIRLNKRIPPGGGLGGGSSDAASILSNLNKRLNSPVPPSRLEVLAGQLGSDVPFFLYGRTAMASGRGEKIELKPDFPLWWYVLICPGFPISTSWTYSQVKLPLTKKSKFINIRSLKERREILGLDHYQNDLEEVVFPSFPRLTKIKEALWEQGCLQALMTGSGSSVFGIWEDRVKAARAFHRLKGQGLGKVFLVRGL